MNENSPKVSIVLPTYNGAKYIRQSIDSCLNQTYRNIELIIVDDGSKDETPDIIKSYNDERIKYLIHEKNKGLPNALNTGFANAKGEYLTWTSDDNQYLPEAIEKMVDCLNENRNIDLVYADYFAFYQDTGKKEVRRMPDKLNLKNQNGIGACFLYTIQVYRIVGDYNPKYELVEDYDYWIRINKKFKSMHYPNPLYIYTEHSKSLKSTRHDSIILYDGILKYQNGCFSLFDLGNSIYHFFFNVMRSKESLKKKANIYYRNIYNIYKLSPFIFLSFFPLLIYHSTIHIIWIFIQNLYEYLYFTISFSQKMSHLKISNNKKNILFIAPHLAVGGAERVFINIAKKVDPEKFSFHIIKTKPSDNAWYNEFNSNFQNIFIPVKKVAKKNILNKYFRELINKLNVDIVLISNSIIGYEYLSQLKSEFKNVKTIDILHSEDSIGANYELERATRFLDRRICISNHLKEYMINKYIDSGYEDKIDQLTVIHNGIDLQQYNLNIQIKNRFKSKYNIPDETKIISFIGRFSSFKDPILFVEIAERVITKTKNQNLKFVMGGDGDELDKIKDAISRYGINDYFILPGMINNVKEVLTDTNILLVTSKSEGIPFVILEAMAMKVPVISTNVGAVNEVINDGMNGFLINMEKNVVDLFAFKILEIFSGKLNLNILTERAREMVVSEYSLETMGMIYQSIFDELVNSNRPH